MLKAKIFIVLFFLLITFSLFLYYQAFEIQIGKTHYGTFWVKNAYQYKEYLAKNSLNKKKILVISGSNGLFGIDSKLLSDDLGYEVINLSTHASLDLEYFYFLIEKYLKKGDIVLMPLEFAYYKQEQYNDFHINNMIAWGKEDYIDKLDLYEKFNFIMSIPKSRIYKGLYHLDNINESYKDKETVVREVNFINDYGTPNRWRQYSHKSLTKYGDFNIDSKPTKKLLDLYHNGIDYKDIQKPLGEKFIKSFKKIQKLIKEKQAQLILTWPVTIKNEKFDLSKDKFLAYTELLKKRLKEEKIDIYCDAKNFNMDIENFFDTIYHANLKGSRQNTKALSSCLKEIVR